jgi:hypothetical protein
MYIKKYKKNKKKHTTKKPPVKLITRGLVEPIFSLLTKYESINNYLFILLVYHINFKSQQKKI